MEYTSLSILEIYLDTYHRLKSDFKYSWAYVDNNPVNIENCFENLISRLETYQKMFYSIINNENKDLDESLGSEYLKEIKFSAVQFDDIRNALSELLKESQKENSKISLDVLNKVAF